MAKEKKWKYKHLTQDKFDEYQNMSEADLIETIKAQASYQDQCLKAKAGSEILKDVKKDVADYRKKWMKENAQEWEDAQAAIDELKKKRDEAIEEALQEMKDVAGALNDAIAGANEHIEALLFCLRFHK